MSKFIVKPDFWALFPQATIAVVLAKGVDNASACPEAEALLESAHKEAGKYLGAAAFAENPAVAVWREAYRQFKEEKTEQILQLLRRFGFHWNHCIEKIHTTTPLSYRDYTGTIDGSAYGIVKNYQYPQISFVSTRTKLKNLFLTGQNLNVHGALGVTLTAMLTCSEFVGQEYLAKKVGNA